ncbi:hypothetical protein E1B28_011135 [Marasmius oreades]|uniref:Uncharacterized protein n=1 Tax=Marasmius oreades TaxID=181124 RepID=A0A9P7UPW4_9AGAR|nr:uncharacterized protein E1B28_011135 [Marasmius oreades]KAG7089450.1 hypothetical protein E1B28_011135 [Marasmius oreades]
MSHSAPNSARKSISSQLQSPSSNEVSTFEQEKLFDSARIPSMNPELKSPLKFRGKSPRILKPSDGAAGQVLAAGESSSSSEAQNPSPSIRVSTPPPTASTESLRSLAGLKASQNLRPTRCNSVRSKRSSSTSSHNRSPVRSIRSKKDDSSVAPSRAPSVHSTADEEEYCNDLLSNVLNESKCLVVMMKILEWPEFLSLSQTCRGTRRAVLDGYERSKEEGRGVLGAGRDALKRNGSHSSLSNQRNAGQVLTSAPVKEEVPVAYVEGYRVRRIDSHSSLSSQRSIDLMSAPVKEEVLAAYVAGYRYLAGRIARVISRRNAREATASRLRSSRTVVPNGRQSESMPHSRGSRVVVTKSQKPVEEVNRIKVTLEDLQLLYLSSLTPLHVYPTHALASLSSSSQSRPALSRRHSASSIATQMRSVEIARNLQELTLAHSKFVILLRNMADQLEALRLSESKRSSLPNRSPGTSPTELEIGLEREEEEDLFDVHIFIGGTSSSSLSRSRRGGLRELVFPAPLASNNSSPQVTRKSAFQSSEIRNFIEHGQFTSGPKVNPRSTSLISSHVRASTTPTSAISRSMSSFSLTSLNSQTKARSSLNSASSSPTKRLSFTRNKLSVAPPLPSEPKTLTAYSTSWRRSLRFASESHRKRINRRSTLDHSSRSADEFERPFSDKHWIPERPDKQFTDSPPHQSALLPASSSGSDLSNTSSTSTSRRNSQDLSSGNSSPSSDREEKRESSRGREIQLISKSSSVQFDEKAIRRMSALEKLNGEQPRLRTPPSTGRKTSLLLRNRSRVTTSTHPSSQATSPHDLVLATSTLRAPILRVFVPCAELSSSESINENGQGDYFSQRNHGSRAGGLGAAPYAGDSGPADSIQRIEAELTRAGIWKWMRGGEVVVNFGYMPGAATTRISRAVNLAARSQTLSPSRESQIFANFTPSPSSGPGAGGNGKAALRLSSRFASGSEPPSRPPSAYRPPSSTSYATPGPSRRSSATNIANLANGAPPNAYSRPGTANGNPSTQNAYDSVATSSTGPTRQKWLIFNGTCLVPYSPSTSEEALVNESEDSWKITKTDESFLPLDDPLSLPSPFYYDHILGAEGKLKVRIDSGSFPKISSSGPESNKSHVRSKSDPFSAAEEFGSYFHEEFSSTGHSSSPEDPPEAGFSMSLQTFPTLLRSPGSSGLQGGWVTVRRWRWVAKALIPPATDEETPTPSQDTSKAAPPTSFRLATNANGSSAGGYGKDKGSSSKKAIGRGWLDQTWVLEGEGTKEGKETLISCLKTSPNMASSKMEWEIVRERTNRAEGGKGTVWFRLLTPSVPLTSLKGMETI